MHSAHSINVIESYLNKCSNVVDGRCNLTWKHEECKVLMEILYEMTEDNKYKEKEWLFDPNQKLLWDQMLDIEFKLFYTSYVLVVASHKIKLPV